MIILSKGPSKRHADSSRARRGHLVPEPLERHSGGPFLNLEVQHDPWWPSATHLNSVPMGLGLRSMKEMWARPPSAVVLGRNGLMASSGTITSDMAELVPLVGARLVVVAKRPRARRLDLVKAPAAHVVAEAGVPRG